jgi:hypothetical protein
MSQANVMVIGPGRSMAGLAEICGVAGAPGSGVRTRIPAAGVRPRPHAVLRVCTHCKGLLGAKDGTTGREIALADLQGCRLDYSQPENMITGGVCPECFERETGTPWPGTRT